MTGYIEGGSATALVARFAPAPYDVGVDGLTSLEAVAHEHHLGAQLLVSNYDNTNSDFSRAIADRVPAIAVWELSSVDDLG